MPPSPGRPVVAVILGPPGDRSLVRVIDWRLVFLVRRRDVRYRNEVMDEVDVDPTVLAVCLVVRGHDWQSRYSTRRPPIPELMNAWQIYLTGYAISESSSLQRDGTRPFGRNTCPPRAPVLYGPWPLACLVTRHRTPQGSTEAAVKTLGGAQPRQFDSHKVTELSEPRSGPVPRAGYQDTLHSSRNT